MHKNVWFTFTAIAVVVAGAGYVVYPSAPDLAIGAYRKELKVHLGLDLQGGTRLVYDADTARVQSADREDALQGVRDVIERRVNAFGVSEPVVQTSRVGDQWRVSVELAGVKDVQAAIRQIGETPLLDFREETPPRQLRTEHEAKARAEEALNLARQAGADFSALAKTYSDDPGSKDSSGDLGFARRGQFVEAFERTLFDELGDGDTAPEPIQTEFGYHIIKRLESRQVTEGDQSVLEVHGQHILVSITDLTTASGFTPTNLSGKNLRSASVQFDPNTGQPEVGLQFDDEGAKLFADITKRNVGKQVAIYLDEAPISTPVVQQEIPSGTAVITGDFSLDEAKTLARRLNAGALPVPITLVSQQTVGPTLGQDSVARSLFAGLLGLATVMLFMLVYYRLPGLIACVALVAYALIVLAIFKLWPVTLTLAGVAGFILSIGMAVDANILIFERFREELRAGRPLTSALDEGFRRAWLSIRDSNVSSLITAFILAWFGTSIIKGFAVTLAIGIMVSMFSAITITRTLLRLVIGQWLDRHRRLIGSHLAPPNPPS
ncbi:MAG: protein translocase subunit SecD [Candidatus Kerfeldbacteria bacterium]|nr:protein translocase subunit SecD [Candidatus Kerfeldbacteria bacterium]